MFIGLKNATSSSVPGAESDRGTLTTFRVLKESVRPADFPDPAQRESRESRTRGWRCRGLATPCRAPRNSGWEGSSAAKVRSRQDRGTGHSQAALLQGTKVGLPRRGAAHRAAPGPSGAQRTACGGGDEPDCPSPAALLGTC